MRKILQQPWMMIVILMVYAVFLLLFHQLVLTAWTLQYSYLGILGIVVAIGLVYYTFPKSDRRPLFLCSAYILMAGTGIASVLNQVGVWRWVDYVCFFLLAFALGLFWVRLRWPYIVAVIGILTGFQLWIPFDNISVLSAFTLSLDERLADPSPLWSHFPAVTVPSGQRSAQSVLTLAQRPPRDKAIPVYLDAIMQKLPGASRAQAQRFLSQSLEFVSIRHQGAGWTVMPASAGQLDSKSFVDIGLVDFPFRTAHVIAGQGHLRLFVAPTAPATGLLSMLFSPETLPQSVARLANQSTAQMQLDWESLTHGEELYVHGLTMTNGTLRGVFHGQTVDFRTAGLDLLGVYSLVPKSVSPSPQAIVEGNNTIQVIALPPDRVHVIATLYGTYSHPLTSDILFADLAGDHVDSLLINTVPAQIVSLSSYKRWRHLWVSGQASFRFESIVPRAQGSDLLIANAPATFSTTPTRYLGGYVYDHHQLQRVFRIYRDNLVNIETAPLVSVHSWDLMATVNDQPSVLVLVPSRIPWLAMVDGFYGLLVLIGLIRRVGGIKREPA